MTVVTMLRPLAFGFSAAFGVAALLPGAAPAAAQQYGAPSRYGQPYSAPSPTRALDGSHRRPALQPAYHAAPRPGIWQGLYAGGNAGYLAGTATPTNGFDSVDYSGAAIGAHVGYNWQSGNIVVGLEGDAAWSNGSGTATFTGPTVVDAHANWTSSLRGRVGYAFNNVLLYATGGAAFGGFDLAVASGGASSSASSTVLGYVVGGGVEMKFTPTVSGRVEALYYGFDDKNFNFGTGSVPVDLGVTTVRAGLTFHFN